MEENTEEKVRDIEDTIMSEHNVIRFPRGK